MLQCVTVMNINYQRSPETEQFMTAKISGNALKQGSRTHLMLRSTTGGQNRYGLVCAVMTNPPELPINDEARNEAHIASTGVRRY